MKLFRVAKVIVTITCLALVYTYLQMQIFQLAYQGKIKEEKIRNLRDENGAVNYKILSLKSSVNLGDKLLEDKMGLQFLDNNQVIKVVTTQKTGRRTARTTSNKLKNENPLLNLFSLKSQAEAKQIERTKRESQ